MAKTIFAAAAIMIISGPAIGQGLIAHDAFLLGDGTTGYRQDLNVSNSGIWFSEQIATQAPTTLGFDGTTAWAGSSHYHTTTTGLSYVNGGELVSSGAAAYYGTSTGNTRALHREITSNVAADLPAVYYSVLIQYPEDIPGYVGIGISETDATSNTTGRSFIMGASNGQGSTLDLGYGAQSGVGNSPGGDIVDDLDISSDPTLLYVAKLEMNAGANDMERISIWINPDLSLDEAGNSAAKVLDQAEAEAFGNSSDINHFAFWSWRAQDSAVVFDEPRLGTTWTSVTPTTVPEPTSALMLGFGLVGLISAMYRRRLAPYFA